MRIACIESLRVMYEYDPPIVRWGAWIISYLKRQNTSFLAEVAVVLVDEIQYSHSLKVDEKEGAR